MTHIVRGYVWVKANQTNNFNLIPPTNYIDMIEEILMGIAGLCYFVLFGMILGLFIGWLSNQ